MVVARNVTRHSTRYVGLYVYKRRDSLETDDRQFAGMLALLAGTGWQQRAVDAITSFIANEEAAVLGALAAVA